MKRLHYIQISWVILLVGLLLGLAVSPAGATSRTARQAAQRLGNATSVNATIYITTGTLVPIFQSRIDQQVPVAVNSAINSLVSKLPKKDQGWALQIATTLIQPSAALTSLTTQSGGLATSLRLSLFPGDPQPINASMLVNLSVINSSTIQVSAKPLNGSPTLVNGPLSTFHISLGKLSNINTTPGCGDAALGVHLLFPVSLVHVQVSQVHQTGMTIFASRNGNATRSAWLGQAQPLLYHAAANTNSYVELPASSLASIGNSIGNLPINSSLTAQNIQLGVQGSNLVINSDVYDSFWGKIGTATTTAAPTASGGNLAVHVLSTTLTILNIFKVPVDSYNQQIQQTLNAKLNGALAGKFNVTQAAIGPNAQVPCAAGNSLVLTGTTRLG